MAHRLISDKTRIPLGLAILAIGGGAWWLSALYSDVQLVKREVAEVKADVKSLLKNSEVAKRCPVNEGPYAGR